MHWVVARGFIALMMMAMCQRVSAQPQAMSVPPVDDRPATLAVVTPPLSDEEVETISAMLLLSEEQRHLLEDGLLPAYRRRVQPEYEAARIAVHEAAVLLADRSRIMSTSYANDTANLLAVQAAWQARSLDEQLSVLDKLSSVLTVEQKERLPEIIRWRKRLHADLLWCYSPGAKSDLFQITLKHRRYALLPEEAKRVLSAYGESLTPLMLDYDQRRYAERAEIARLTIPATPQNQAVVLEAITQRSARLRPLAILERRIWDLNDITWPALCATLPPELAVKIEDDYRMWAYGLRVYPDAMDTRDILDEFHYCIAEDDPNRARFDELVSAYRKQYAAVTLQMEVECKDLCETFASSFTGDGQNLAYKARMRQLRFDRWELSKRIVDQTAALLPPEPRERHAKWIEHFDVLYKQVMKRAADDGWPQS